MRWTLVGMSMALTLAAMVGCKQQCFMTEPDYNHYKQMGEKALEVDASVSLTPATTNMAPPTTILDTNRKVRYVTLAEAIASTLEKGTTGVQSPFFPGAITDLMATFNGFNQAAASSISVSGSDSIRVLALQPAIVANQIESSLSRFDALFNTSMTWNTSDTPVGTALQTFQARAGGAVVLPFIQQQNATFTSALIKPLPTGGMAGITFTEAYNLTNLQQRVNPAYQPSLTFGFEQPILRGFGTELNQLLTLNQAPAFANSQLFNTGPRAFNQEGIVVTRLRFDEQRAEFERNINFTLWNVEQAYWNLYGTYWTLYSREQALKQAYEAWKINRLRFESGRIPIMDYAQSRQQYELFRAQRITALDDVLEKERQLRGFMGLPVEDGTRLVPVDEPKLAPYYPDWHTAVNEALALRPELVLARNELKYAQLNLIRAKNQLLPDLRFTSSYGFNGLGSTLAGGGPNSPTSSFSSLASGQFVNWGTGLNMTMPIGFRDSNMQVRNARLNLAQAYATLQDQENKATRYLTYHYRHIVSYHALIQAQRSQRLAAAEQLEARFREFLAGRGTLDILLEAQRVWADALQQEFSNIVQYNNALSGFEFAKGTIMQYNNVLIAEGQLPVAVSQRAVENERARSRALELRQHPAPPPPTNRPYGVGTPELPGVYTNTPRTPQSLLEALPEMSTPIPDLSDPLPAPRMVPDTSAPPSSAPLQPAPGMAAPVSKLPSPAAGSQPPLQLPAFLNNSAPTK